MFQIIFCRCRHTHTDSKRFSTKHQRWKNKTPSPTTCHANPSNCKHRDAAERNADASSIHIYPQAHNKMTHQHETWSHLPCCPLAGTIWVVAQSGAWTAVKFALVQELVKVWVPPQVGARRSELAPSWCIPRNLQQRKKTWFNLQRIVYTMMCWPFRPNLFFSIRSIPQFLPTVWLDLGCLLFIAPASTGSDCDTSWFCGISRFQSSARGIFFFL